jgi:hypothetical protein
MTASINKAENDTARIERKIFLPLSRGYLVSPYLIKSGFRQQHQSNHISSVYFDNTEYQNLRDNVDGNMYRSKLRARWYNENLNQVRLEIKNKKALIGTKKVFLINESFHNLMEVINFSKNWSKNHFENYLMPTAFITYDRKYFIKNNMRVTIDTKVKSQKIIGQQFISGCIEKYSVVEFKYSNADEQNFRNIFEKLNLPVNRITKSSKYANALIRRS